MKKKRAVVQVAARPIERQPGQPAPTKTPADTASFEALYQKSGKELTALGLGAWDGKLWLFPGDWYDHIPEGLSIETVGGEREKFKHGETPRDLGFGMLAFGIRIKPKSRERKH